MNGMYTNIGVWVKPPQASDYACITGYGIVFSAVVSTTVMHLSLCDLNGSDMWGLRYFNTDGALTVGDDSPGAMGGAALYVGKWVHIGLSVNPTGGFRLYMDGVEVEDASSTPMSWAIGTLRIGLGSMGKSTPGMRVDDWHVDTSGGVLMGFEAAAHKSRTVVPVLSGTIFGLPQVAKSVFNVTLAVQMASDATPAFVFPSRVYGFNERYSIPVPHGARVEVQAQIPTSYEYPTALDAVSYTSPMTCTTPGPTPVTVSNLALDLNCVILVAFYRFENSFADQGPFGISSAVGVSGSTFFFDPKRGSILALPGGSSRVDLSASPFLNLVPPFKVSLWVKLTGAPETNGVLLRLGSFILQMDASFVRVTLETSNGATAYNMPSVSGTLDWTMLIVRVNRDMSGSVTQVNQANSAGTQTPFSAPSGTFTPSPTRHVGGTYSSSNSMKGSISDLRIFSGADQDTLTTQVSSEYSPAASKRIETIIHAIGLVHDVSASVNVVANTPVHPGLILTNVARTSSVALSSVLWSFSSTVTGAMAPGFQCSPASSSQPYPGHPDLVYVTYCSILVGSYDFNDAVPGAWVTDASGFSHGLTGTLAVATYDLFIGFALDLSGATAGATSSSSSVLTFGESFTVSFWFKLDTAPPASGKILELPGLFKVQWNNAAGSIECEITSAPLGSCGSISVAMPGAWNHLAFSVFEDQPATSHWLVRYLNGALISPATLVGGAVVAGGSGIIKIGFGIRGWVARVRIWRGARSPAQVTAEYVLTRPQRWLKLTAPALPDRAYLVVSTSSIPGFDTLSAPSRTLTSIPRSLTIGIPAQVPWVVFTTSIFDAPPGATCYGVNATGGAYPSASPPAAFLPCFDPNGLGSPGWDVEWFLFNDASSAPSSTIEKTLSYDTGCSLGHCTPMSDLRFRSSNLTIPVLSSANCPNPVIDPAGLVPTTHGCEVDGLYARFYSTCELGASLPATKFRARLISPVGGARIWLGSGPWSQAVTSEATPAFAALSLSTWDRLHPAGVGFEVVVEWYVNSPDSPAASLDLTFEDATLNLNTTLNVTCLAHGNVCGDGRRRFREACDDGNLIDGDGCSATCRVESGYRCTAPSPPAAVMAPSQCSRIGGSPAVPLDATGLWTNWPILTETRGRSTGDSQGVTLNTYSTAFSRSEGALPAYVIAAEGLSPGTVRYVRLQRPMKADKSWGLSFNGPFSVSLWFSIMEDNPCSAADKTGIRASTSGPIFFISDTRMQFSSALQIGTGLWYCTLPDGLLMLGAGAALEGQFAVATATIVSPSGAGLWHHATLSFSGSSFNFYLNGDLFGNSVAPSAAPQGNVPAGIIFEPDIHLLGSPSQVGRSRPGAIGDLRLFNRDVTKDEARILYEKSAEFCRFEGIGGLASALYHSPRTDMCLVRLHGDAFGKPVPTRADAEARCKLVGGEVFEMRSPEDEAEVLRVLTQDPPPPSASASYFVAHKCSGRSSNPMFGRICNGQQGYGFSTALFSGPTASYRPSVAPNPPAFALPELNLDGYPGAAADVDHNYRVIRGPESDGIYLTNHALTSLGAQGAASSISAGSTPSMAFDGVISRSLGTYWASAAGFPQSLTSRFSRAGAVSRISVFFLPDGAADAATANTICTLNHASKYAIEYWDSGTYVTAVNVTGNRRCVGEHVFRPALSTARIRLTVYASPLGKALVLELKALVAGRNVALASLGSVASATSVFSGGGTWGPNGAISGDTESQFHGAGGDWHADVSTLVAPQTWTVRFSQASRIDQIDIFGVYGDYNNPVPMHLNLFCDNYQPKDFVIEALSYAGTSEVWSPVVTVTGNVYCWRRFTLHPPVRTSALRVTMTAHGSGWNYAEIYEFQAWQHRANVASRAEFGSVATAMGPEQVVINDDRTWWTPASPSASYTSATQGPEEDVTITFTRGPFLIEAVDIFFKHDNDLSPAAPGLGLTCSTNVVPGYRIQYRYMGKWITLVNVKSGNDKCWVYHVLNTPVLAEGVRVLNTELGGSYLAVAEVQVWAVTREPLANAALSSSGAYANISSSAGPVSEVWPMAGAMNGETRGAAWSYAVGGAVPAALQAAVTAYPVFLDFTLRSNHSIERVILHLVRNSLTTALHHEHPDCVSSFFIVTSFIVHCWSHAGSAWVQAGPAVAASGGKCSYGMVDIASKGAAQTPAACLSTDRVRVQIVGTSFPSHIHLPEVQILVPAAPALALVPVPDVSDASSESTGVLCGRKAGNGTHLSASIGDSWATALVEGQPLPEINVTVLWSGSVIFDNTDLLVIEVKGTPASQLPFSSAVIPSGPGCAAVVDSFAQSGLQVGSASMVVVSAAVDLAAGTATLKIGSPLVKRGLVDLWLIVRRLSVRGCLRLGPASSAYPFPAVTAWIENRDGGKTYSRSVPDASYVAQAPFAVGARAPVTVASASPSTIGFNVSGGTSHTLIGTGLGGNEPLRATLQCGASGGPSNLQCQVLSQAPLQASTALTCQVPAAAAPGASCHIEIHSQYTGALLFTSAPATVLTLLGPAPRISSVSPASGLVSGGFNVTITGSNLASLQQIVLAGTACPPIAATLNDTYVVCVAGPCAGPVANGPVTASTASGGASLPPHLVAFSYLALPPPPPPPPPAVVQTVSSVAPSPARYNSTVNLTITGSNLGLASLPPLGVTFLCSSAAPGAATSGAPGAGGGGGGGGSGAGPTRVACADVAQRSEANATSLACVFPGLAMPGGAACGVELSTAGPVVVFTQTTPPLLTVAGPPPMVASVSPSSSPVSGGVNITLSGTGFSTLFRVSLGGVACAVVPGTLTPTAVVCTAGPSGVVTAGAEVTVDTTSSGPSVPGTGPLFAYTAAPAGSLPLVTLISPDHGSVSGGQVIFVSGSGFGASPGNLVGVTVGGLSCLSVNWASSTFFGCSTPAAPAARAGSSAVLLVTVAGPLTSVATPSSVFWYHPASLPVLEAMQPRVAAAGAGGQVLTITGSNFFAAAPPGLEVSIAGARCLSTTWVSPTVVLCAAPPRPASAAASPPYMVVFSALAGGAVASAPADLRFRWLPDGQVCDPPCAPNADCIPQVSAPSLCDCVPGFSGPPACQTTVLSCSAAGQVDEDATEEAVLTFSSTLAPTAPVTVPILVSPAGSLSLPADRAVIAAGSRTTAVTVRGVMDTTRDGPQVVSVRFGATASADPTFSGITLPPVRVSVRDSRPVIRSINPATILAAGGTPLAITAFRLDPNVTGWLGGVSVGAVVSRAGAGQSEADDSFDRTVSILSPVLEINRYYVVSLVNADNGTATAELYSTEKCVEAGSFTLASGRCGPCPEGAECPGGDRLWPLKGYWAPSENAGFVVKCVPEEACIGTRARLCQVGYGGPACSECDTSSSPPYTRVGLRCERCPPPARAKAFIVSDILIWALIISCFWLVRDKETVGLVLNLVRCLQQLASLGASADDSFDSVSRQFFTAMKLFSGDITFAKLDCLGRVNYSWNFYLQLMYSGSILVAQFAGLGLVRMVMVALARGADNVVAVKARFSRRARLGVVVWCGSQYYILTKKALAAITCVPLGADKVLSSAHYVKCGTSSHTTLLAVSAVILALLTVAFPAALAVHVWRNRALIAADDPEFSESWGLWTTPLKTKGRRVVFIFMFLLTEVTMNVIFAVSETVLFGDMGTSSLTLLLAYALMIGIVLTIRPYKDRLEGAVNILLWLAGLIISVGAVAKARSGVRGGGERISLYIVLGIIAVAMALLLGGILLSALKDRRGATKAGETLAVAGDTAEGDLEVDQASKEEARKAAEEAERRLAEERAGLEPQPAASAGLFAGLLGLVGLGGSAASSQVEGDRVSPSPSGDVPAVAGVNHGAPLPQGPPPVEGQFEPGFLEAMTAYFTSLFASPEDVVAVENHEPAAPAPAAAEIPQ